MALILKNVPKPMPGRPVLAQWVNVSRVAAPVAPATDILFRVYGGRILMHLLVGEVTTVIQTATTNTKISSKKLDATPAAVGTAVDLCANVDGTAKEVGSLFIPIGSGAAAIWSNAGAGLGTLGRNPVILPQGEIYATFGGASTGAMKWDIWYQPLDPGAYVVANGVQTVI